YSHQRSPDCLLIPYTVEGSITVVWGVISLGLVLPKTAMLEGQKTLDIFFSLARFSTWNRELMFRSQPFMGNFSAVALSMAAIRYTSSISCWATRSSIWLKLVASAISKGPDSISSRLPSLISLAMTLSFPSFSLRAMVSSVPICPHAPMISIFEVIQYFFGAVKVYISKRTRNFRSDKKADIEKKRRGLILFLPVL